MHNYFIFVVFCLHYYFKLITISDQKTDDLHFYLVLVYRGYVEFCTEKILGYARSSLRNYKEIMHQHGSSDITFRVVVL